MNDNRIIISMAVLLAATGSLQQAVAADVQPLIIAPTLEEVIVIGEFIPDERRDTSEIANVLDKEALSLLADSSVGGALARVTGLSLVGGKYVYVRGLGERYSTTLLNGARISSPVPFQKTVPLDLVPKSIVDNLLVQKTYSPQYPGDFSGGIVDIRTKATPNENYFSISAEMGGNSETTGGDGLFYRGGEWDNWGYDDGTRDQPDNVAALSSEAFEDVDFPADRGLGASFYNFWDIREKEVKPGYDGEVELGLVHDFDNGLRIGFNGAGKYRNTYLNINKDFARYEFTGVNGGSNQTVDYQQNTTRHRVNLSGFYNIGMEYEDHSVALSYTILRQSDDETQQFIGVSSEDDVTSGTQVESYRLQWTENEIESLMLKGEHYFDIGEWVSGATVDWRIVDGAGERLSPDTRTYTYAVNNDGLDEMVTSSRQAAGDLREVFQAPERNYAELQDDIEEYGLDVEMPFLFGLESELIVKFGGSRYERNRESVDRLFRFDITPGSPSFIALQTPGQFFGLDNWRAGYLDVRDFSASAANASGIFPFAQSGERVDAVYLGMDAQLTPRIRVQAGVRQERTELNADAYGGNTLPDSTNAVTQKYDDTLPSMSLTWEVINDMQIRLAYSETVNRPSLLEITGSTIRNPEDSNLYRGNVFLEQASLQSFDVRWEWYLEDRDQMSVGVFKKDFTDPVEIGKVQAQNDIFTWFNAEEAELKGVELEFRKGLRFDQWFGWGQAWEGFSLNANVSFIDSNVTLLGAGETAADVPLTGGRQLARLYSNERRITGQSDVLGNLILTYSDYDLGLEGSLAYNYTGDRIALVGADNAPDILEEDRGQLDLLVKYFFDAYDTEMEVELKVRNLLDEDVRLTQGGQLYERYDPGMSYSVSFKVALYR